jgi:hypothetical protein
VRLSTDGRLYKIAHQGYNTIAFGPAALTPGIKSFFKVLPPRVTKVPEGQA